MEIKTRYWTANDSRYNGRKCTREGIMVHSTATPGVMAADWHDRWNKGGIGKSVHFFVDDVSIWNYMETDRRSAHCGGEGNDTHVSIEICEPRNRDEGFFEAVWNNAVWLVKHLCAEFGLTAENVISHSEGKKLGIASNHGDPEVFFAQYNKTMDDFRSEVLASNKPSVWAKESVDKAINRGIIVGDGKGDLRLKEPVTREALCVILDRLGLLNE